MRARAPPALPPPAPVLPAAARTCTSTLLVSVRFWRTAAITRSSFLLSSSSFSLRSSAFFCCIDVQGVRGVGAGQQRRESGSGGWGGGGAQQLPGGWRGPRSARDARWSEQGPGQEAQVRQRANSGLQPHTSAWPAFRSAAAPSFFSSAAPQAARSSRQHRPQAAARRGAPIALLVCSTHHRPDPDGVGGRCRPGGGGSPSHAEARRNRRKEQWAHGMRSYHPSKSAAASTSAVAGATPVPSAGSPSSRPCKPRQRDGRVCNTRHNVAGHKGCHGAQPACRLLAGPAPAALPCSSHAGQAHAAGEWSKRGGGMWWWAGGSSGGSDGKAAAACRPRRPTPPRSSPLRPPAGHGAARGLPRAAAGRRSV